jgi:hypothetical protein
VLLIVAMAGEKWLVFDSGILTIDFGLVKVMMPVAGKSMSPTDTHRILLMALTSVRFPKKACVGNNCEEIELSDIDNHAWLATIALWYGCR